MPGHRHDGKGEASWPIRSRKSPWACRNSGSTRPWPSRRPSTKRRSRCGAGSSPCPGSSTGPAMSRSAPRPPRSSTRKTPSGCSAIAATRPAVYAEPVLICYALVNRPYIVDLQPDRSVVKQFLASGFEVYLIDWGVPSAADRSMTLKDYVDGLMKNCVERRPPAAQDAEPPPGRLLHGRHDVDHLHRPQSRAGQDAHHHGRADRLRRRQGRVARHLLVRTPTTSTSMPWSTPSATSRPRSSRPASR